MDIRVDHEQFYNYTKKHGLQKTLDYCKKQYPDLELYEISEEWFSQSKFKIACVVLGRKDNLVFYWNEY